MTPYPHWLGILSWAYLSLSFACAAYILADEIRRPQKMAIMNAVWPITALYFGPLAVWGYRKSGSKLTRQHMQQMQNEIHRELDAEKRNARQPEKRAESAPPSVEQVAVGVSHCGAGCTLGDIAAEWWVFLMGLNFAGGDFQTRIILDLLLAWGFGIVFQYLTIVPMRGLSFGKGLIEAIRVDTLSIVTFQMGMFAWMALAYFVFFPSPHLKPTDPVFWFMMQIAMILGFFTAYPANRMLLRRGLKEKMPQYFDQMKQKMRAEQSGAA